MEVAKTVPIYDMCISHVKFALEINLEWILYTHQFTIVGMFGIEKSLQRVLRLYWGLIWTIKYWLIELVTIIEIILNTKLIN